MPTRTEIIDAMHFDLSLLTQPFNTTADAPYLITYEFATGQPDDLWNTYSGWSAMSNSEKAAYRGALDHIETLINVEFVEHEDAVHGTNPTMNVGQVILSGNTAGEGGLQYSAFGDGSPAGYESFTVYDRDIDLSQADQLDLILHELGHALGNKHPFSGSNTLPAAFENNKYTVMSYDSNPDNDEDSDAMQIFDILSLQARWGANDDTESGNTTYTGSRSNTIDSIWDTGGIDTFDASAISTSVTLDLREAAFSTFEATDDVSIAYDVVIENAVGGSAGDLLRGNASNNTLSGGAGKDKLVADKGADILLGGKGKDALFGSKGKDTLNGNKGDDKLTGGKGDDTFIFAQGGGSDVIKDFSNGDDTLELNFDAINSMSDLQAVTTQNGDDLELDFAGSDSLILRDIDFADLSGAVTFA